MNAGLVARLQNAQPHTTPARQNRLSRFALHLGVLLSKPFRSATEDEPISLVGVGAGDPRITKDFFGAKKD